MAKTKVWGSPIITLSAPAAVTLNATATGAQLGIVATGTEVELKVGNGPASVTQILSFRIPVRISGTQRLLGFVQDVTLSIMKSNGVRVLVVADLAGTTKTFEEGFANPTAAPLDQPLRVERLFSLQGLAAASLGVLGVGKPAPDYEATFVITVQRVSRNDHAIVSIDSLDVIAHVAEQ